MNDLAELERERRDGTLKQRLNDLVKRQKHDAYCRRTLAELSPHLTREEKAYCRKVDLEAEE